MPSKPAQERDHQCQQMTSDRPVLSSLSPLFPFPSALFALFHTRMAPTNSRLVNRLRTLSRHNGGGVHSIGTPATWNRYRALLSLTYRLAIRAGKGKENPARLIRHKTENNGRVRFLSREEGGLRKVIREKFAEHEAELDLALHTGLRHGEQYEAKWKDVDFEQRVLTVPLDKGGKTSHVPLNAAALRALLDLHRVHGRSSFVCGGANSPR